jgi:DNA-binding CsgD family transcriptional regulator
MVGLGDSAYARLERLTEKEREALRLVPSHGSYREIAQALGVSESAVRERLQNAAKKLGVRGRHAAARMFLSNDTVPQARSLAGAPKQRVVDHPRERSPCSGHEEPSGCAACDKAMPYSPSQPSTRARLVRILEGEGEHNDLTTAERLRRIGFWVIAGIMLFCLLGAVLNELGQAGRLHRTDARTSL